MTRTILGVDIGSGSVKLALCKGGAVKKTASASMPRNLLREGRVTSPDSLGELIRVTMKENRIRATDAAVVLSAESAYLRTVTMPRMTAEQLAYNIPYEFNDYISDELGNYSFDYAMLSAPEDGGGKRKGRKAPEDGETAADAPPRTMELMAVAAPNAAVAELRETLRKAGLKLVKAAPAECAYISLLRSFEARAEGGEPREYCILDLGRRQVRMYVFRGDRHIFTRTLDIGLHMLEDVIADAYNVDAHIARTYLEDNYGGCQSSERCMEAYGSIAVELSRALNFYRFSNPESTLEDVWLCGGGCMIAPLGEVIERQLDLRVHPAEELLPGGGADGAFAYAQAVGITMEI